jgi:hypothetical protein
LAATMKSFSVKPPIAAVCSSTVTAPLLEDSVLAAWPARRQREGPARAAVPRGAHAAGGRAFSGCDGRDARHQLLAGSRVLGLPHAPGRRGAA